MAGIVGKERFEDLIARDRGPASLGISEYGENGISSQPPPKLTALQRMGEAVADRARAALGEPTGQEVRDAVQIRTEAHYSRRTDQKAASAIADKLSLRGDTDIRRALPDIGNGPIPHQADLRWAAVARAAIDEIHHHVDHGPENQTGRALGRYTRLAAIDEPQKLDVLKPIRGQLEARSAENAGHVANYLSHDPRVEQAIDSYADSSKRRFQLSTPEQERVIINESRIGLVHPQQIVARAKEFAEHSGLAPDMLGRRAIEPIERFHRDFYMDDSQAYKISAERMAADRAAAAPAAAAASEPVKKEAPGVAARAHAISQAAARQMG